MTDTCRKGHPRTPENTYTRKDGGKRCRPCHREHGRNRERAVAKNPCTIPECGRPQKARGWCQTHYGRWRRTGDPNGTIRDQENNKRTQERIEDLEWMTHWGETKERAAKRLGISTKSLHLWLLRHKRTDIWEQLETIYTNPEKAQKE